MPGRTGPPVQHADEAQKPRLVCFYRMSDGRSRVIDRFLAQVLQRRRNHDTFVVHRVDVTKRPDLAERFEVDQIPTLVVVKDKRVEGRVAKPRNCGEIRQLLEPWLA
jgi:thioredoxin-like negative regulator of GroEL